jgi:hypothetical protein
MPRAATKAHDKHETSSKALVRFRKQVERGEDWFEALLSAIAEWEASEETLDGRVYQYLIGGEAFDWLLLAERLCTEMDGAIPAEERDALLFHGRAPRLMDDTEFRHAIGDAKHKAHLNFIYGVSVEEALQLVVEEEVLKEHRSLAWSRCDNVDQQVFERIYGKGRDELLAAYRDARALPPGDELSYGEWRGFTYWLFKYRVEQNDPARVASDTRRALVQLSELEAASRRRAQHLALVDVHAAVVVDGEVVARHR